MTVNCIILGFKNIYISLLGTAYVYFLSVILGPFNDYLSFGVIYGMRVCPQRL